MSYRGRDLDLRTPERSPQASEQLPPDALLVDEAVLACCNHGYDLALAHRAREVRLEHLLNAMTRTDAAVAVLAAHGVDVAGLRHDAANLIASDETIVPGNERISPRRSQLLADILHAAAERARSRNSPVAIADILGSILELNSEQPGVVMLKRNASGWPPRGAGEPHRSEPLPPLGGGAYQADPRYLQGEPPREWMRVAPPPAAYYQAPPPGYYVAEAQPVPASGNLTDAVQNSRLDQMERTIRELSGELLAERRAFSQLVGELRSDVTGHTDSTTRMRGGIDDRLAAVERSVDAKFADIARGWTVLGERLQSLEQAVMTDRGVGGVPAGLVERLQGIENIGAALTAFSERLAGLERAQARQAGNAAVDLQPIVELLEGLEQTVTRRASEAVDLAPVLEPLQAIEARVAEINRGAAGISERVGQFERKLDAGAGTGERVAAQAAERLRAIEEAMTAQRNQAAQFATNLGGEIKAVVGERFGQVSRLVETQRGEGSQAIAAMGERISALEKVLQGFGQRTLDLHAAHGADLVELHNALVKLNGNQQTLAASMDQWRLDNGNELSALLTRLDGVERANTKPLQILESLQSNVQSLQRFTARREEQRSRFKHWLMGTDDWYGASWEHGNGGMTPAKGK